MNPVVKPVIIEQYKTNAGNFVRVKTAYPHVAFGNYILNDLTYQQCNIINGFAKINGDVKSVKQKKQATKTILHYELKNSDLESEKFPKIVQQYWNGEEEETTLKGVEGYEVLYQPVYNETPEEFIELPFEVVTLGEYIIDEPTNLKNRKIKLHGEGNYGVNKVIEQELYQVVIYDDIVKLLTPEFALAQVPCKLSSKQMYSIVRQHLKENLDMKENSITSDYDFCFTVKKRVHTKPFLATGSYYRGNKLKSKSVTKDAKFVEVFEMSWSGYKGTGGYDSYTCIPELHGDSLQDLSDKLEEYLYDIVQVLNKRVQECECCNGTGYIIKSTNV